MKTPELKENFISAVYVNESFRKNQEVKSRCNKMLQLSNFVY